MVKPLRNNLIRFKSGHIPSGMFVVGESNVDGMNVPYLPSLLPGKSQGDPGSVFVHTLLESWNGNGIFAPDLFDNFLDGDIVWLDSRSGVIKSVLSARSDANTLLLTEQCENRCLFCSQPPNELADTELYIDATNALLHFNTLGLVGLSGGEPTKNSRAFLNLLETLHAFGNKTELHILSNGRNFSDKIFTRRVTEAIDRRSVFWGIPLYGHKPSLHDMLVGSSGGFKDTVQGLAHLCEFGQFVELRIVPISQNITFLHLIILFLASNFSHIKLVSIMNLEPKGYGRMNFNTLHVPVRDQNKYLRKSIDIGKQYGIEVRLFNYPLCLLDSEIRPFAAKSISDWKNYYPDQCLDCEIKDQCGGFFTSATDQFIEPVEAIHEKIMDANQWIDIDFSRP